jgi:hypothetical protein
MHKVECELMGGSRGDEVRIWTDVPLQWRHYLEGARHPVEIWTDHKNLEYFPVAQKSNR